LSNKTLIGIASILVGGLLALRILHINIGNIFVFFLPFLLIGCGILGWLNGRKVIGTIFIGIGGLILFAKLSGILAIILPFVLIAAGVYMLSRKSRYHY